MGLLSICSASQGWPYNVTLANGSSVLFQVFKRGTGTNKPLMEVVTESGDRYIYFSSYACDRVGKLVESENKEFLLWDLCPETIKLRNHGYEAPDFFLLKPGRNTDRFVNRLKERNYLVGRMCTVKRLNQEQFRKVTAKLPFTVGDRVEALTSSKNWRGANNCVAGDVGIVTKLAYQYPGRDKLWVTWDKYIGSKYENTPYKMTRAQLKILDPSGEPVKRKGSDRKTLAPASSAPGGPRSGPARKATEPSPPASSVTGGSQPNVRRRRPRGKQSASGFELQPMDTADDDR